MPDHDCFVWAGRSGIDASAAGDPPLPAASRWPDVLRSGQWHRMNGALAIELARSGRESMVPSHVGGALRASKQKNAVRALRGRAELAQLLDVLSGAGISAMALKGAALVHCGLGYGYPDAGARPMNDLDVLIEPTRLDAAFAVLATAGYRPLTLPDRPLAPTPVDHHHRPPLTRSDGSVIFELHHHVVPPAWRCFPIETFWERAQPVRVQGRLGAVPASEDLLLHLCLHFAYDRSFRAPGALMQLTDIARVVALSDDLDWDQLASVAAVEPLAGPVAFALASAQTVFSVSPPADVLRCLTAALEPAALEPLLQHRVLPVQEESLLHFRSYFHGRGLKRRLLPHAGGLANGRGEPPDVQRRLRAYGHHVLHAIEVCARPLRHPRRAVEEMRAEHSLDDICRL
jgi:hypothetical protein